MSLHILCYRYQGLSVVTTFFLLFSNYIIIVRVFRNYGCNTLVRILLGAYRQAVRLYSDGLVNCSPLDIRNVFSRKDVLVIDLNIE